MKGSISKKTEKLMINGDRGYTLSPFIGQANNLFNVKS